MNIRLIKDLHEGIFLPVNDRFIEQIVGMNTLDNDYPNLKIYIYDPDTNVKFEVMPEVSKQDISKIDYALNDRDYIIFASSHDVAGEVYVDFYAFDIESRLGKCIYTASTKTDDDMDKVKFACFGLTKDYCLIQEKRSLEDKTEYTPWLIDLRESKRKRIETALLKDEGITDMYPISKGKCAIKIGSKNIGIMHNNQFVSDMNLGLDVFYTNLITEADPGIDMPTMKVTESFIAADKINHATDTQDIIIYDVKNKVTKVRQCSLSDGYADISNLILCDGVPYFYKEDNEETIIINMDTMKEESRFKKSQKIGYFNSDTLVVKAKNKALFSKSNNSIQVFKFPQKQLIYKHRGRLRSCIMRGEDLLIFI